MCQNTLSVWLFQWKSTLYNIHFSLTFIAIDRYNIENGTIIMIREKNSFGQKTWSNHMDRRKCFLFDFLHTHTHSHCIRSATFTKCIFFNFIPITVKLVFICSGKRVVCISFRSNAHRIFEWFLLYKPGGVFTEIFSRFYGSADYKSCERTNK